MYWHRIHKTSLRVKNTIPESMPCTMCALYCGWGDHNLPEETSCYISILYFHYIFPFHRKTHLRCISSVLLNYNCKINANIQDVYHRPNLERARKGRLPLVFLIYWKVDRVSYIIILTKDSIYVIRHILRYISPDQTARDS